MKIVNYKITLVTYLKYKSDFCTVSNCCLANTFKMRPNWFSGSLSLQCRLQFTHHCRFN